MKTTLFILLILALYGCATEGKFRERMDTFVGTNVDSFIVNAGPPQSESKLSDGSRLMQWTKTIGNVGYASASPYSAMGMTTSVYCTIRLVVDSSNSIKSYSYEGNNCKLK